jgi:DNA-binding NarL/FixJ family response regulator
VELVGRATDRDAALRLIQDLAPDVAVLDLRMPKLGRIEIARKLDTGGSKTGVILYTGDADRGALLRRSTPAPEGFLLRPLPLAYTVGDRSAWPLRS